MREGITQARLSLHGMEATHDWFVGRSGAYADLMEAAKRLEDHGISVGWNVFLSKANTNDVEEMIGVLRSLTADVDPFINVTVPTWKPNRRLMEYEPLRLDVRAGGGHQGISGNVASPDVLCGCCHSGCVDRCPRSCRNGEDFSAYRRQEATYL